MAKTVFVCSGGGAKGSFEIGVIKQLTDKGIKPDALYGTSTGALNAAGYSFIGVDKLLGVWRGIKNNNDIMTIRPWFLLPFYLLLGKGKGVYSMAPLQKKIEQLFQPCLRETEAVVCRVSLINSAKDYVSSKNIQNDADLENFRQAVLASASTPILNDVVGGQWVDGGVRQIVPLSRAINDGATDIYVILGEPYDKNIDFGSPVGNVIDVFNRTIGSMVQEMFWKDIHTCAAYNHAGIGNKINLTVYAPSVSLIGADEFDPTKIEASIQQGLKAEPVFIA